MGRAERAIVFLAVAYMAGYLPLFFAWAICQSEPPIVLFFTLHFIGMALNFTVLVLTIRDLYKRPFSNPNDKLTWLLLILCTGGIGWLVYLFKYAIRPRRPQTSLPC
jgi:hypothetical protein